jgi:predicted Zn-dependent protease
MRDMPLTTASRKPRSLLFRRTTAAVAALAVGLASVPAPLTAQEKGKGGASKLVPVRDAEIEQLLRDYTAPIFKAAGINAQATDIVLIRDFGFNAFVANGRKIFVNVGALLESETPNQLIGVLAHETGHIAGGHLAGMRQKMAEAQTRAIIATLLGVAAVGAAAAGGAGNVASGAAGAMMAPREIIKRDIMSYARALEQAADQAAISYLGKTGQSAKGMIDTFRRFADESMFSSKYSDPYARTHPMPTDRIANLEALAKKSPSYGKVDSDALRYRHAMAQAKTIGFLKAADAITRSYPARDTSMPARYARAISAYRFGRLDAAIPLIDELIRAEPDNAYFWELKGQAYLEGGRPREAVSPLQKAVQLAPDKPAALIRIMLAQALVATGNNSAAIAETRRALAYETDVPAAYRTLAMAYGRSGDNARADVASAQAELREGDIKLAKQLAMRAKTKLPTGSPSWLQADDIVNYKEPELD